MPNAHNLDGYRFTSDQDRKQASINGRKGGKASQAVQKRKRTVAEAVEEALKRQVKDIPGLAKIAAKYGLDTEADLLTIQTQTAVINELKSGDYRSLLNLQELRGEKQDKSAEAVDDSAIDNIIWGDKQEAFIKEPLKRINLLFGSVRSGKTYVSLVKFAQTVKESPAGSEFLIAGKTLTSVQRNCFGILADMCGKNWNVSLTAKKGKLYGRTVWIEGANDKASESKIRGMTLQGAYIDELTQIPEEFYLMCLSRLSKPEAFLIATTNPDHPKHYVKTQIIDNEDINKQVIKFSLDDNIHLDPIYIENLKKEYSGVFYDRFILGEFVRAEGLIYRDFAENPARWIIPYEKVPKQFKRVIVGFDIGGNGSAYAMTCTGQGYNGVQYRLKSEKRQAGEMNMNDIEKFVNEFCGEVERLYNVNIEVINCDHIAVIVNTINDNTKYRARLTYKPPVTDRVFLYSKLFATDKLLFVEGQCDDLIEEMQNIVFDDKAEDARPLDDGSYQIDCYDSACYSEADYWQYIGE